MEKVANLQKRFKERPDPTPDTNLNESMLPLLKDFYQTQEQRDNVAKVSSFSCQNQTISYMIAITYVDSIMVVIFPQKAIFKPYHFEGSFK